MRILRRLAIALGLLFVIAALWTWGAWSPGAPVHAVSAGAIELPQRFRNSAEHDVLYRAVGHPYLLEIPAETTGRGALCYYGARHASDPDDPQLADIEARWQAFAPTVALCEGRARGFMLGWPFSLAGVPEPAFVHQLARAAGVRLLSLEPSFEAEVRELLTQFTAERVALYFVLRVYRSETGSAVDEALALDLLRKRTDVEGLRGALTSLADMDRVWARDFPGMEDWRTQVGEPREGFLAQISDASRRIRGEHMVRVLTDLVRAGERVFAVVGSSHVIRQEWALRSLLGAPPAADQPR